MTHLPFSLDDAEHALHGVMEIAGRSEQILRRAYARVAWSCLVEPGDGTAGQLIAVLGPDAALEVVARGPDATVAAAAGLAERELIDALARWRPRLVSEAVDGALNAAARAGIWLLTPDDEGWPPGLDDLGAHAPVCLWVRGDVGALPRPQHAIAIVGARAASGYGEHVAMELAADFAGRGVTVVSGAAYGIDGAAHRAALAAGGPTVALLAGGVDRPYPVGHRQLLDRIAVSGAVASEVPCGVAPTKWRFLQRNRTIAAMAGATVVVEAGWRSGSLNTASHAALLGRPLGAVPGQVTSAASAGCHRLLREYDARCITCAEDAAELLGISARPTLFDASFDDVPRTGTGTRIVDALTSRSWRSVDDVARLSGMAPADVEAQLGMLRLTGDVQSDGRGWRRTPVRAP